VKKALTILSVLTFFASANVFAIPQMGREALIALYESTDGDQRKMTCAIIADAGRHLTPVMR
jgi:hypothetical protein